MAHSLPFTPLCSPAPYKWCSICNAVYVTLYMQCHICREKGGRGSEGEQGNKAPESDWSPKAADCFQRLTRLPEVPGSSQGPREAQGWGKAGGQRGARGIRPMSLTKDPKLQKVFKGSQGFLRPQGGPRSQGRLRVWGARRSKNGEGSEGNKTPDCLTEDPRLLKTCEGSQGFLRPQGGPGAKKGSGTRDKDGARGMLY